MYPKMGSIPWRDNTTDGARGVVADPEWWCEQADTHRQHHHHRIVHLMHAYLPRDREQQRSEAARWPEYPRAR